MYQRYAIAFGGACVVTLILIYGMSTLAAYFNRPDSQVYLRVMDVIPVSDARRRPRRPVPEAQPERTRLDVELDTISGEPTEIVFEEGERAIDVSVDLDQNDVQQH